MGAQANARKTLNARRTIDNGKKGIVPGKSAFSDLHMIPILAHSLLTSPRNKLYRLFLLDISDITNFIFYFRWSLAVREKKS